MKTWWRVVTTFDGGFAADFFDTEKKASTFAKLVASNGHMRDRTIIPLPQIKSVQWGKFTDPEA